MSKKQKTPRRSITSNLEPWIRELSNKMINTNAFTCSVSILIESRPFHRQLANEFDKFCQYGYRSCIKCISTNKIKETIFTNCSKNGESNPLSLLCDEIMTSTGKYFTGKIPNELYKYLIKYIILDYKERRIREKWISVQNEIDFQNKLRPYLVKTTNGKPNTKGIKMDTKKGNETKGNKNQPTLTEKLNTQLHKRNENMKCLDDIHDEPEGGPDLYIILIESQNSKLPLELIEIDIPITSIVQMGNIDISSFDDNDELRQILEDNRAKNDEINEILKHSYLGNIEYQSFLTEQDIRSYWSKMLYYMNRKHQHDFEEVVLLKYIPVIPEEPRSPNFIENLRRNLYDGISKTVFESYTLKKMHNEYIQNVKFIDVDSQIDIKLEDLDYYLKVMDIIPQLSCSTELILDTLISQVCKDSGSPDSEWNFLRLDLSKDTEPELKLPVKTTSCVEKLIRNLGKSNQFPKVQPKISNPKNITPDIKILSYGNEKLGRNIVNLEKNLINFIKSRTLYVYNLFWDYITWSNFESHQSLIAGYRNAMKQKFDDPLKREIADLLMCLTQLEDENDEEILEQFTYLDNSDLEDYYLYIKKLLKRICLNLNSDIFIDQQSVCDLKLEEVNFQNFEELFRLSSHYKFLHLALNDKLAITFYDKRIPLIKKGEIPIILSLRDFIEDISKENRLESNIIMNNKEKYNYSELFTQKINKQFELNLTDIKDKEVICRAFKYHGNSEEWIMSQYETIYEDRCKYKFWLSDSKRDMEVDRDSAIKPFIYNIGRQRKLTYTFFDLNIKINKDVEIFLKYWDMPHQEKYQLNINARIKNHNIYYNTNVLPEGFILEPFDIRHASLHIEHESGMLFSITKLKSDNYNLIDTDFPVLKYLKIFNKVNEPNENIFKDNKLYNFELNISWPTGLTIKQTNLENIVYIKQKYLSKKLNSNHSHLQDESHRCILNNGCVIKFMKDNSIIIFFGNGKIINCTKFINEKYITNTSPERNSEEDEIEHLKMLDFELRRSDGTIFSALNGILKENQHLFSENINNILKGSITTEFSDGIVYEYQKDCSLTVQFMDGTRITSYPRFSDDKTDSEETQMEPFTIVELAYKIDHPCYASVVFSYSGQTSIMALPEITQVMLSNNIHINFKEEIQIFNYKTSIIVQQTVQGKVQNELIFSFENFRKRSENEKLDPFIIARDSDENSVFIYDNGKFQINDSTNNNINQGKQVYIVDRKFRGIKVFSKFDMNKKIKSILKGKAVLRQIKKEHLINNSVLMPIMKIDKWSNFYDFLDAETPVKYPSTYGKYWYNPFKEKSDSNNNQLEAIAIRHFNEIINTKQLFTEITKTLFCSCIISQAKAEPSITDDAKFNHFFLQLENMLTNQELSQSEYNKGTLKIQDECEKRNIQNYLKKIVFDKTGQRIYQSTITNIQKRFEEDKANILNNRILPYFENGEGLAFLLLREICDEQFKIETQRLEEQELKELLFTPLKEINSKDLKRMKELFIRLNTSIMKDDPKTIHTYEKILEAGKKLENYFANIDEVLHFHQMIIEGVIDECI